MITEHSHNGIIATVRASLALNNPAKIADPIFGLLGNAAAAAGQGSISVSMFAILIILAAHCVLNNYRIRIACNKQQLIKVRFIR